MLTVTINIKTSHKITKWQLETGSYKNNSKIYNKLVEIRVQVATLTIQLAES